MFTFQHESADLHHHTLPSLFWAALILLRGKQRKYWPWNVYSPEQKGVFCDCFASFQIAKTFILKLKCSAFIRNTSFTENWKGRLKNWVLVWSVRILVPTEYWATYCKPKGYLLQTPKLFEKLSNRTSQTKEKSDEAKRTRKLFKLEKGKACQIDNILFPFIILLLSILLYSCVYL